MQLQANLDELKSAISNIPGTSSAPKLNDKYFLLLLDSYRWTPDRANSLLKIWLERLNLIVPRVRFQTQCCQGRITREHGNWCI